MAAIRLKWWMINGDKTLFAVPEDESDFDRAKLPLARGIVLEDDAAITNFSYKCYWQLFVEFLPVEHFKGIEGNCRMILESDFGAEKVQVLSDFVTEKLHGLAGVHPSERIYRFNEVGLGHKISASGGRVVPLENGAEFTIA